MLELQSVSFSYEKGNKKVNVLDDISVKFKPGVFYTIFGPSGSGKTTLLSLLGGLDVPQKGKVLFDTEDVKITGLENLRKNHVSFVFQNFNLFSYMTAIENVMVAIDISKIDIKNKKEYASDILQELGLNLNEINRKVKKLSGGQQQRVAIARALAVRANYILADEPTGNLDKKTSEGIVEIFKQLVHKSNKCVIAVTHSDLVKQASDISYNLENGSLDLLEERL